MVSTQLTRLLVSGKPQQRGTTAAVQAYLDSSSLARRVEVRASTELHDRVLVADDGDVLTLGTSLNGVGKKTTVLTPIPSPAREKLRKEYDRLWAEATLVGPPLIEEITHDPEEAEVADSSSSTAEGPLGDGDAS